MLARFNRRLNAGSGDKKLASNQRAVKEAVKLMRSPALKAFELDKVPTTTINRYGDTAFGRGALLAKRLRLPYTVVLVAAGLIVSGLASLGSADTLGLAIHLSPELLLQLFLPILLFALALIHI